MTPHYDWTPASEPPDTMRIVLVWKRFAEGDEEWATARYMRKDWGSENEGWGTLYVTHWRDVSPPDVEAPK